MQLNFYRTRFTVNLALVAFSCFCQVGLSSDSSDTLALERLIHASPETSKAYTVAVVKFIERTVEEQPLVAQRYLEKIKKRLFETGEQKQFQFLEIQTSFYQKNYHRALAQIDAFLAQDVNPGWQIDANHYKIRSNFRLGNFAQAILDFNRLKTRFGIQGRYESLQRLITVSSYKVSDYNTFKKGINRLSAFFPYSVDGIWAFDQQFKVCHPKPSAKKERLSLLKKLSWGADIYPGLGPFVNASLRQPMFDRGQIIELSDLQRVERLYKMRMYSLVAAEAKKLLQKSAFTEDDRGKLMFLRGKALVRSKNAEEALMVFSELSTKYPGFESTEVATWLADSLRYLGLFAEAHDAYAVLLKNAQRDRYIKWNYFWTAYRSGDYSLAMDLLDSSKVSFREGDRRAASLYWRAKTLQKLGREGESEKLYDKLLDEHGGSFYVAIYYLQNPRRYKAMNLAASQGQRLAAGKDFVGLGVGQDEPSGPPTLQSAEFGQIKEHHRFEMFGAARQKFFELTKSDAAKNFSKAELQWLSALIGHPAPKQKWMRELELLPSQQPKSAQAIIQDKKHRSENWMLYYPRAFEDKMPKDLTETSKLMLWSIMRAESYYRPRARSHVGAMGLMQIMPYTGVRIAEDLRESGFHRASLEKPEVALKYGSYYVKRLMKYFGNPFMALAGYNAGPENVRFWAEACDGCGVDEFIESIPFRETRKYVKKITKTYLTYRQIYDADQNIEETREISVGSIKDGMSMY